MGRLSALHVNEFSAVRELCYRGLDSATLRERVGDRLSRHLGGSSYCFGATDPATALPVHSVSVGLDPAVMQTFYGLVLATPSLDFGPWIARSRRAARLEDLVDDVEHDPYTTEILRPCGLRYDVQVACIGGGWSWGHMCLRRRQKEGPFEDHEVRFLEALAPHLTAGLRAAASRAALAAAPGKSAGVVVIGPDGKVELANGVAEQLFRQPVSGTRQCLLTAVQIVAAQLERRRRWRRHEGGHRRRRDQRRRRQRRSKGSSSRRTGQLVHPAVPSGDGATRRRGKRARPPDFGPTGEGLIGTKGNTG